MDQPQLNWIANYIWGIADDVLRDLYVRGKYRDVILPMTVLRRLDSLLEPTKPAVLEMKATLDKAGIVNQDQALRKAAAQPFYNTSTDGSAVGPRRGDCPGRALDGEGRPGRRDDVALWPMDGRGPGPRLALPARSPGDPRIEPGW